MSSFIATASPAPAASPIDGVVINDGWYPDVSLTDMRDAMRLDGTLTAERIRHATRDAVLSVNCELSAWRMHQVAAGHAALDDVPAVRVDGESAFVHHYLRAVYHRAYADVTEKFRGYDSTKSGGQDAADLACTVEEARRNARWAVSAILGVPNSTVELI